MKRLLWHKKQFFFWPAISFLVFTRPTPLEKSYERCTDAAALTVLQWAKCIWSCTCSSRVRPIGIRRAPSTWKPKIRGLLGDIYGQRFFTPWAKPDGLRRNTGRRKNHFKNAHQFPVAAFLRAAPHPRDKLPQRASWRSQLRLQSQRAVIQTNKWQQQQHFSFKRAKEMSPLTFQKADGGMKFTRVLSAETSLS